MIERNKDCWQVLRDKLTDQLDIEHNAVPDDCIGDGSVKVLRLVLSWMDELEASRFTLLLENQLQMPLDAGEKSLTFANDLITYYENSVKYCRCGEPVGEYDTCPYANEIHDDDTPCDCCDKCRQICANDI